MKLWHRPTVSNYRGATRGTYTLALQLMVGLSLAAVPQAKAAFITDYAIDMFTVTNTNANGSAMTPDNGLSILLTGGNNGSGTSGITDFTATAASSGVVQFAFSFLSLDKTTPVCGINSDLACDYAGYLVGGVFTQIADDTNQITGTASFNVLAGQTFGFRVGTVDNTGEPGVVTISGFSAPESTQSTVPEPGTAAMATAGIAVAGGFRLRRRFTDKFKAMAGSHGSI